VVAIVTPNHLHLPVSAAFLDARFDVMESSHSPSLVKMWDGMWSACGESGAILA